MEARQQRISSDPSRAFCFLTTTIAGLVCLGCSDPNKLPTAPASGVVTLDGKPVSKGAVLFTPTKGRVAMGTLNAEGQFVLSTYGDSDGAIIGQHQVAIIAQEGSTDEFFERAPKASEKPKWLIPARYGNGATSDLSYEITNGKNTINLELTTQDE